MNGEKDYYMCRACFLFSVYEILCIVGSSNSFSALWSDQPFCRHWAVSWCAVFYWKSLACICLSLQYVGKHLYVNLMGRRCSGVTIDPNVHRIHDVYILLVKIWHCVVNSLGINWIVNLLWHLCALESLRQLHVWWGGQPLSGHKILLIALSHADACCKKFYKCLGSCTLMMHMYWLCLVVIEWFLHVSILFRC